MDFSPYLDPGIWAEGGGRCTRHVFPQMHGRDEVMYATVHCLKPFHIKLSRLWARQALSGFPDEKAAYTGYLSQNTPLGGEQPGQL